MSTKLTPVKRPGLSGVLGQYIRMADYRLPLLSNWEFLVEEILALSSHIGPRELSPKPKDKTTKLCYRY